MYKQFEIAEVKASNKSSMLFLCHPGIPESERYLALKHFMQHSLEKMKVEQAELDDQHQKLLKKEG